jgi:hypothetical protein
MKLIEITSDFENDKKPLKRVAVDHELEVLRAHLLKFMKKYRCRPTIGDDTYVTNRIKSFPIVPAKMKNPADFVTYYDIDVNGQDAKILERLYRRIYNLEQTRKTMNWKYIT